MRSSSGWYARFQAVARDAALTYAAKLRPGEQKRSKRMPSPLSHRRVLVASAGTALSVLATVAAAPTASVASTQATPAPATLSASPLGVNVAPWDYAYYASSSVNVIQPLLKAAGVDQLRY